MKKNYLLICLLLVISITTFSQSVINFSGWITSNTTWSYDTVKITGDVTISNGNRLTISSGTYLLFLGQYLINVQGSIMAQGAPNDSIYFVSNDSTGLYNSISTQYSGFSGILFDSPNTSNDSSIFSYCVLKYAKVRYNTSAQALSAIHFALWNKARISNCDISYNNFNWSGGILCNYSSPLIFHNKFTNNSGKAGGAIACFTSNATISENIIYANYAEQAGGGIFLQNSNPTITNNYICNNTTKFSNCGPADGGGGIRCTNGSNAYIANNLIANNHSGMKGGGIECLYNSNPIIENNTIVNNNGYLGGGGLYLFQSNPTVQNTILWGNTRANNLIKNQVFLYTDDSDPTILNSCIEGDSTDFMNPTGFYYTGIFQNNISSLPLFINPAPGAGISYNALTFDWRLQSASLCINTGTNTTLGNLPSIDLWYNPRITGASIDIGAYEAQSKPTGITDLKNNASLSIYPNPAADYFTINYSKDYEKAAVSIVNTLGQIIENKTFKNSEKIFFNTADYASGAYFLNIIIDEERMSSKLIKQ